MVSRSGSRAIVLMAALVATMGSAAAFDDAKYPDLKGQWTRAPAPAGIRGQPSFDPSKSSGRGQEAPLTPEYQAIFEANLADQASGGFGTTTGWRCGAWGLPAIMNVYQPMEIIVMPRTTFIRIDYIRESRRRIFTDGRAWPKEVEPGFDGYSIGKWIDEDGDGKFDVLEAETRYFSGPRAFDLSGIPLHEDNETVIKERIYLDKADKNLLHDEITVTDNALTRPWTVKKSYRRSAQARPEWPEYMCVERSETMRIGSETYRVNKEGYLLPSKKGQKPPSVQYFPVAER